MSTNLDPIFASNSQLFKVSVYDIDGVTELTPLSCVCSVWDRDTGTAAVSDAAGTVGAGYAQYNWAGIATAGTYEVILTVTISASVIKSEHFIIEVKDKPPAFTMLVSTDIGKVRLLIPDRDQANAVFSDDEIQAFLDMNDSNVRRAAAEALEIIASDEVMTLKVISTLDLTTNGAASSDALLRRAKHLRELADIADTGEEDGSFDYAEMVTNAFTKRERAWKQYER